MPIIANTTSGNTFSAIRAQLNSVTKRINQFAINESTLYANTINANTVLKISGTDVRATFAQNTYVKSVLANTNSFIKSQLANTNSYIATQATRITLVNTNLTGTNTALRTLAATKLAVSNAAATYAPIASPTFTGTVTNSGQRIRISNASDPGIELSNGTTVKGYLFYDTSAADVVTLRHATTATGVSINSSGNIGIGTTAPGNRLHVDGSSADNIAFFRNTQSTSGNFGYIAVGAASSISSGALFGQVGSSTTTSQRVMIGNLGDDVAGGVGLTIFRGSGNVGIGTNAPACKLHLAGSGDYAQQIRIQDTSIANRFFDMSMNSTGPYFWAEGAYSIQLYTNSSERMRIESSGAVNLYGGSGGTQLRMYNGGDLVMYPAGNASTATIYCDNAGEIRVSTILTADGSVRAPIFYDSNDTGYYLDPNGSSQIQGHTRFGPYAGSSTTGNVTGVEIMNNGGTGDSNLAAMSFHCSGSYGTHLHLRADGYFGAGGWSAGGWRWYVYMVSGDMTAAGNVTAYSDPRLKTNIINIESPLEKLKQLNGVRFKWIESSIIGHPGEYDYGILSSDVEKVMPELVIDSMHESPDGDKYKTVAYDKLSALLIEGMKEQQKQIEELREQIELLKGTK
jgi:hypothetical protein